MGYKKLQRTESARCVHCGRRTYIAIATNKRVGTSNTPNLGNEYLVALLDLTRIPQYSLCIETSTA